MTFRPLAFVSTIISTLALAIAAQAQSSPTISYVLCPGENTLITVTFSVPLAPAPATNKNNYIVNNGIDVLSARLLEDNTTVVLRTTPMTVGNSYILTVNNVSDLSQPPNVIVPNTQRSVPVTFTPVNITQIIGGTEPAGPSSRRTPFAISEIMYHPTNRLDGKNLEFIEIHNSNPWVEDLGGYRLAGDVSYFFPTGTTISALGYRVIAAVPADVQSVYGIANVLGPLTNSADDSTNVLDNGGGTIEFRDELNSLLLEIEYDDEGPWPASPDDAGHSLVLARPSYGAADPQAWAASDRVGGSPGAYDFFTTLAARSVVINEILAHTDDPQQDFIELYNYSASAVDVSDFVITDDPTTNKFRCPTNTTIPARGFLAFNQTDLGFALDADGETIYFIAPDGSRVISSLRFTDQENGVAYGRYPDGAPTFRRLSAVTQGTSNARARISNVVINEVQYHPVTENEEQEFVELYNRGSNAVALAKWRLSGGISYTFPNNTTLPAGGYLVVAKDKTQLLLAHSNLNSNLVLGNYSGSLANSGETIQLDFPDEVISTNQLNQRVTNQLHIVVDEVRYLTGGRWGRWADGAGSSLERRDARAEGNLAPNWADSDETSKSEWTTVEFTGLLDLGGFTAPDQLQLFLMGAGECLVDNVEVIDQNGVNRIVNGTFDSNTSGWFFQGTHQDSAWQATGGFSGGCLRVVASGRGDTGANRIRTVLNQSLAEGSVATLRAKVRWLTGHPEILLRLRGNWLEAVGDTLTTARFGSPGARNTRALTNAGPAITGVTHTPVLPPAGQPVTVSARIEDPDGITQVLLKYRVDPASNYVTAVMNYAGAGFYTGVIPAQGSGGRVAFHVEARDGFTPTGSSLFPAQAPVRECLVTFGESTPPGNFGAYRLWVSQRNVNRWSTREKQSNHPLDATFVYGGSRICYNIDTLYSGSPWHTPGYNSPNGNACDYELNLMKDDLVLGADDFVLATIGNLGNDATYQGEQTAFWITRKLGAPYLHRRYIRMYFNGQLRAALYEDAQQPNGDVVSEFFPDDDEGSLHKVEDWFEFDDTGDSHFGNRDATLENFTTTGGAKKTARYRWTWRPRSTSEAGNAFTNLYALVDALDATRPEPYRSRVAALVDMERFMRVLAMERIVGNWDSWGYNRGKNMYAYKPANSGWVLIPWDIDFVLSSGGDEPTDGLFGGNEPVLGILRNFPEFQRAYWRAFEDAVNGPLLATPLAARLDTRYNALSTSGVGAQSPTDLKNYVAARRTYILSQLATVAANFTANGAATFSTNRNLITLTGTAPIGVATITVNGLAVVPTWTSVTSWTIRIALSPGVNNLTIQGRNLKGEAVAGASATRTITYTGVVESPQDRIVINEIMYNPLVPDTAFVELYSTATNNAFDLSNWRLNGLDGTIPPGTILEPGGYLIFVKDSTEFARVFGSSITIAGVFEGDFDKGGETIQLIRPGATPAQDTVIDQVTYEDDPPWPAAADGTGPSLQLIDATRDNNRVGNWATATVTQPLPQPQVLVTWTNAWKYMQTANLDGVNWTASGYNDAAWPSGPGILAAENCNCLPEIIRTPLTVVNGRRTFYFRTTFVYTGALAGASLKLTSLLDDGAVFYLNGQRLHAIRVADNPAQYSSLADPTIGDANYEGPATISASTLINGVNTLAVEVHQNADGSSDLVFGMRLETDFTSSSTSLQTPGFANSIRATLPAFPTLWLNELLPINDAAVTNSIADRFGEREPWVELYNGGTNAINLSGYYLSTNYANPLQWAFPNATINPGQFLIVWLDGEAGESTVTEWHASFRLPAGNGALLLSHIVGGKTNILDYLNYSVSSVGRSYGDFPDANVSGRRLFSIPTPAGTNISSGLPVPVFINEWLADNVSVNTDPADSQFEDWFELYNAGSTPVDLSGYYLTDSLTNKTKWQIPSGTTIAPGGYLLVWADEEGSQNIPGGDLHANFKLGKDGEALGLYGTGGVTIDALNFGAQTTDVSQGRFGDGGIGIFSMTPTPRAANIVAQTNAPPVLDPLPNRTVGEGTLLTFTAVATDTNLPAQELTFSLLSGAPIGASIGAIDGAFAWLPTEAQGPGNYSISVRVADSGTPSLSATQTFSVQVNEVNAAPVLSPLESQILYVLQPLTATNSATDSDTPAQTLTFSLETGAPDGMVINPTTGDITWTPTLVQAGNHPVTVRVTDNGEPAESSTQPFTITVLEVPNENPPRLTVTNGAPGQFTLIIDGEAGQNYVIEVATNGLANGWTPISTNTLPTPPFIWSETIPNDVTQRYYRVRLEP